MQLTLNIKEQNKIASFLKLIKEFDYIEIVNIEENVNGIPIEHKEILNERLQKVEEGKTSFEKWDTIKKKYE